VSDYPPFGLTADPFVEDGERRWKRRSRFYDYDDPGNETVIGFALLTGALRVDPVAAAIALTVVVCPISFSSCIIRRDVVCSRTIRMVDYNSLLVCSGCRSESVTVRRGRENALRLVNNCRAGRRRCR